MDCSDLNIYYANRKLDVDRQVVFGLFAASIFSSEEVVL